jgi:uncharacterized coiled-coil DUF342 family protein
VDTPVATALIAAGAAVLAAYFSWRASTRATDVNARAAELGWVKELRQDAADARTEVAELRTEVREVRRQLVLAQREADYWLTEKQALHRQAWRPGMTIERLRDLIGPVDPPAATANGR